MVRFKNRYLLFELVWKDGRFDESISERRCPALGGSQPAGWLAAGLAQLLR